MTDTQETIADIIAEMRDEGHTGESSCLEWVGTKMRYYADRLEAAWKREKNAIEANALAVGGMVGASQKQKPTTENSSAVGNTAAKQEAVTASHGLGDAAKMREALEAARDLLLPQCNGGTAFAKACGEAVNKIMDALKEERTSDGNAAKMREALKTVKRYLDGYTVNVLEMRSQVDAALAAPPRNCDRFATLEDAYKAHREICEEYGACNKACVYKSGHSGTYQCFEAWLFAPATEQEEEATSEGRD